MRKAICILTMFFAASILAGPSYYSVLPDSMKSINQRVRKLLYLQASSTPFTYMKRMNLTSADSVWTCPDSVWITAIYCSRTTNVRLQLRGADSTTIPIDSLCGLPFDVYKMWKRGTDSLSWVGYIYLLGIKNNQ